MPEFPATPSEKRLHFKAQLLGSPLFFTQSFYKVRTGRDFSISEPTGRESHFITICKALKSVFKGEITKLLINVPPRYGKTELIIHFIAWALAHHPDSNFIYTSYSHTLAKKQTKTVRDIITLPIYKSLFGVEISQDTSAKDNFETIQGGSVYAAGSGGTVTGLGAGIKNSERFGGAILIDDIHKPVEVTSDTIRQSEIDWFSNTLLSRRNSLKTPIIFIGQRLHEDDLPGHLLIDDSWTNIVLPSLDELDNALYPEMHSTEALNEMRSKEPYVFSSQMQQNPSPSGGGIFKPEWFVLLEEEPNVIETFITVDTAETNKDYNDATVFSFWGIYKIEEGNIETDIYGLHWIDCLETRIEPKDLQNEFMNFYAGCMRHRIKPKIIGIEKKSTGVTMASVLKEMRGLIVVDIERTVASGNKASRYLGVQKYIASRRISLPEYGKHSDLCIEHCRKITSNNSHRHDDIADTLSDAIVLGLQDNVILGPLRQKSSKPILSDMFHKAQRVRKLRESIYARSI